MGNWKIYKTIVYVDAFNLYYWVLKNSQYKWLDIEKLVKSMLKSNEILEIKYFFAWVKWDERDPNKKLRQETYINALIKHIPIFKCYEWQFFENVIKSWKDIEPPHTFRKIHTREEKWTDVNLAVHIVNDTHTVPELECICLVSNDSDLSEAIKISKNVWKSIVTIAPITYEKLKWLNWNKKIPVSYKLRQYSDVILPFIHSDYLSGSQLPQTVWEFTCPSEWL